jgi:hypothetical protein
MRRRTSVHRQIAAAVALVGSATAAGSVGEEVSTLAAAICASPDVAKMSETVANRSANDVISDEQVAEAFGVATFVAGLGRCANEGAIAEGYALYKSDKDKDQLDAAFAVGHVSARPDDAKTAAYKGSFEILGGAGEPASSQ